MQHLAKAADDLINSAHLHVVDVHPDTSQWALWCATILLRWTPHPAIVVIRDNQDYIRVLLYSYYTTITGWGVLLKSASTTS